MATTLADFKGWQIIVTDENGKEFKENTRRSRRRTDTKSKEFLCLKRKSDGLVLGCGDSIVCREPQTGTLSIYMIHEIRQNTASNYIELWCLGYLCWYEVDAEAYYAQFLPEVLESCPVFESAVERAEYFGEKFQQECNRSEIYLTVELSEIYLRDFVCMAQIYDSESFSPELITEENQTSTFVVNSACEPYGNKFVSINIREIEDHVRTDDPEKSKRYLKELTANVDINCGKKRKTKIKSRFNGPELKRVLVKLEDKSEMATLAKNSSEYYMPSMIPKQEDLSDTLLNSGSPVKKELGRTTNNKENANIDLNFNNTKFKRVKFNVENSIVNSDEDNDQRDTGSGDISVDAIHDEDDEEGYILETEDENGSDRALRIKSMKQSYKTPESPTRDGFPTTPKRKLSRKNVARSKKAYTPFSKLYKTPQDIPDLNENKDFYRDTHEWDISALENQFRSPKKQRTVETIFSKVKKQLNSLHDKEEIVRASNFNDYLPARENEFATIYLSMYSAIEAGTGTSIYIAGTPGVGKTLTVREVVKELLISMDRKELPCFQYIEINGLKMVKPTDSYEFLWKKISGSTLTSGAAMESLEYYFKQVPLTKKRPVVVLLDELDALVTKTQDVMYNFFNWTTYENSKLIVVAIANTMDLPERQLGNKVSSRIGFTRIMFTGYTHEELKTIINLRLMGVNDSHFFVGSFTDSSHLNSNDNNDQISETISKLQKVRLKISDDAIEIASRKIASVSGDARRALKVCKRAVEIAEHEYMVKHGYDYGQRSDSLNSTKIATDGYEAVQKVEIQHITKALHETINSPIDIFMNRLSFTSKLFLYALVNLIKKSGNQEQTLGDIIDEIRLLIEVNGKNKFILKLKQMLFFADGPYTDEKEQLRIISWDYLINQLVEAGLIIKQNLKNERMCAVKLSISLEEVSKNIMEDEVLKTL